jgi:hypothetical protein
MENDNVNHPQHYTDGFESRAIECIDITRHLSFDLGNAFKYVWRAGKKGGKDKALEDLEKARWYVADWASSDDGAESKNGILTARAIFALLKVSTTPRYQALHALLYFSRESIFFHINELEKEIENGK